MNYYSYDIREHNWIVFHRTSEVDIGSSFWKELLVLCWKFLLVKKKCFNHKIKAILGFEKKSVQEKQIISTSLLFIANTINNERALAPIWRKLEKESYAVITLENIDKYYPKELLYQYSLKYIWPLILMYIRSNANDRRVIRNNMDTVMYTMGFLRITEDIINSSSIKLVVMANDHSPLQRSFQFHASMYGIKTMYVQHATVTDKFPPLNFDISVLDGKDSFDKYVQAGPVKGNVFLLGNPRFDSIPLYREKKTNEFSIGVAVSRVDDIQVTRLAIMQLIQDGYSRIIFRPHPNILHDKAWISFMDELLSIDIPISNPYNENPYCFLGKIGILISGESGLHLDSLLMDVPSICYNFSNGRLFDIYGYVAKGWLRYAKTLADLRCQLDVLSNNNGVGVDIEVPRYYNTAFGLPVEGETSSVIGDLVRSVVKNESLNNFNSKYNLSVSSFKGYNLMAYS